MGFVRRLIRLLLSLWLLSAGGFLLVGLLPGDPVSEAMAHNPNMTTRDVARLKKLYGLDAPLPVRYARWLGRFARGDWGHSRTYHAPAATLLTQRLGNTLWLFGATLVLAAGLFAAGYVVQGLAPGGPPERLSLTLFTLCLCVPPFWLGLVALFVFSVSLGWLPLGGTGALEGAEGLGRWRYLLLPALVLAVQHVGQWLRLERSHAVALPRQGWHLAGRAKGLGGPWLFFHRQIKTTLGRLSTVWALDLPTLLGGALITETVFNWPGVARLLYESVMNQDSDVAMACLLLMGLLTLLCNLLADWLLPRLDPRTRSA